jgi:NAD(P)-dependent dehydrogenase (short-subunit alcohol dehydrogenase family)
VALVTGAGRGLGRAHAEYLAAHGAAVVVNDVDGDARGEAPAPDRDAVVAAIRAAGGAAIAVADDGSTPEGARRIVDAALGEWGRVDILVHNAGMSYSSPFEEMEATGYRAMLSVHLDGPAFVTQASWPHFLEQGYGRVVLRISSAGLYGARRNVPYAAAKMAVVGLMRALALEAGERNIRVNAIAPGAVNVAMGVAALGESRADAMRSFMAPATVSPVVGWLCDDECPVTGTILNARGGFIGLVFTGETRGYHDPELSMESIAAHLEQIVDRDSYSIPRNMIDATNGMLRHVGEYQPPSLEMFAPPKEPRVES